MQERAQDRTRIERELCVAFDAGQLELFYQPIVDLRDLEMIGMEALVRWRHPERGLLGPTAFLQHAERGRFLLKLSRFVI
jgi:EAL domain-containing protein (putative c-di-GMP-specific phosphodiesterase class I)